MRRECPQQQRTAGCPYSTAGDRLPFRRRAQRRTLKTTLILDATKEVLAAANAKKMKDKRAFMAMLQHQNNEGNYPWSGRRSAGAQPDGGRGEATEGEAASGGVR